MENFSENPKDLDFDAVILINAVQAKQPTEEQEQLLIQFAKQAIDYVQDGECACFSLNGYFLTNDIFEADFQKSDSIYFVEQTSEIVLRYRRVVYTKTVTRFR